MFSEYLRDTIPPSFYISKNDIFAGHSIKFDRIKNFTENSERYILLEHFDLIYECFYGKEVGPFSDAEYNGLATIDISRWKIIKIGLTSILHYLNFGEDNNKYINYVYTKKTSKYIKKFRREYIEMIQELIMWCDYSLYILNDKVSIVGI